MKKLLTVSLTLAMMGGIVLSQAEESMAARSPEDFPSKVTIENQPLVLNGVGTREATIFSVDVYHAGLYVKQKSTDPKVILNAAAPKYLEMHFVRDVDRDDIVGAYEEGFEKNCKEVCGQIRNEIKAFNGLMKNMKEGETMALEFLPKTTKISFNSKETGKVDGEAFGKTLLTIWLGKSPPNAGLKEGLLGLKK